jgi:hypothetical protein
MAMDQGETYNYLGINVCHDREHKNERTKLN